MAETAKEIKPEIQKMADELRKSAKTVNNTVTFNDDAFEASLPEGVDAKLIRKVETHKQQFALAQSLVTGELAVKHFKENKDATEVSSTVRLPVGKSIAVINREKVSTVPTTGEKKTSYGYVQTRIKTSVPGSQMTAVRSRVSELAAKAGLNK